MLFKELKMSQQVKNIPVSIGSDQDIKPNDLKIAYQHPHRTIFNCDVVLSNSGKAGNVYLVLFTLPENYKKIDRLPFHTMKLEENGNGKYENLKMGKDDYLCLISDPGMKLGGLISGIETFP